MWKTAHFSALPVECLFLPLADLSALPLEAFILAFYSRSSALLVADRVSINTQTLRDSGGSAIAEPLFYYF
jgi:hypothetical protein